MGLFHKKPPILRKYTIVSRDDNRDYITVENAKNVKAAVLQHLEIRNEKIKQRGIIIINGYDWRKGDTKSKSYKTDEIIKDLETNRHRVFLASVENDKLEQEYLHNRIPTGPGIPGVISTAVIDNHVGFNNHPLTFQWNHEFDESDGKWSIVPFGGKDIDLSFSIRDSDINYFNSRKNETITDMIQSKLNVAIPINFNKCGHKWKFSYQVYHDSDYDITEYCRHCGIVRIIKYLGTRYEIFKNRILAETGDNFLNQKFEIGLGKRQYDKYIDHMILEKLLYLQDGKIYKNRNI